MDGDGQLIHHEGTKDTKDTKDSKTFVLFVPSW